MKTLKYLLATAIVLALAACALPGNATPSQTAATTATTAATAAETTAPPATASQPPTAADYTDPANPNNLTLAIAGLPDPVAAGVIWDRLLGYWTTADNWFIQFWIEEDGVPYITYGLWYSDFSRAGYFAAGNGSADDPAAAELTILFYEVGANELHETWPEETVTLAIDTAGLDEDGHINMALRIAGNPNVGDWNTYGYSGATAEEAWANVPY